MVLTRGVRYAKSLSIQYFIDIDILRNSVIDIDIFKNVLINIDIFKSDLIDIDIDIFKTCRYIDNRYGLSIYRTPLLQAAVTQIE